MLDKIVILVNRKLMLRTGYPAQTAGTQKQSLSQVGDVAVDRGSSTQLVSLSKFHLCERQHFSSNERTHSLGNKELPIALFPRIYPRLLSSKYPIHYVGIIFAELYCYAARHTRFVHTLHPCVYSIGRRTINMLAPPLTSASCCPSPVIWA